MMKRAASLETVLFLSSFVFPCYACLLNPFLSAMINPNNNSNAVGATNNHLNKVNIVETHASNAGVDGYTESIVTMPRFSNKSNSQAPNGTTLYLCMLLLLAKPRWNSHVIARLKNSVYTMG